jgi:HTH-type transcriptional regulator, sugar sensing transcriptional regulator
MIDKNLDLLIDLGFNQLEAEVYVHLLSQPPSTAYKIGKKINKPTANVYKAIDSLAEKGAVLVEDNKSKQCRAVKPDDFIGQYETTILEKTQELKKTLSTLDDQTIDENSYSIRSAPLVFEKFRSMMQKCTTIAVIDAFPKVIEKVIDSITEAVIRGVDVYIESYEPIEIKGAHVVYSKVGLKALKHWQSQQLNLIIDGEEHIIALLDMDLQKVKQATWSNNLYMSCILHAGCMREQTILQIMNLVNQPGFEVEVKMILEKQKFFFNSKIPGFDKLFTR